MVLLILFNLPLSIDSLIEKSIYYSYKEEFSQSESLLLKARKRLPGHPGPYFYLASLYEVMLVDYGEDSLSKYIFAYSDSSINAGKKWIEENPGDAWAYFFTGGSYTVKIFYYALGGEVVKAIPYVGPALKWLSECKKLDSTIVDVNLGLGGWEYFKGYIPFLSSRKKKGLKMIKKAVEESKYVSNYAVIAYSKLMIREKKYDKAIKILKPLTDSFPDSRTFNWPLLTCYFENGDYKKALEMAERIISVSEDNLFSRIEAGYYKARILLNQRKLGPAINTCNRVLRLSRNSDNEKIKELRKKIEEVKKEILKKTGKS